MEKKKLTVNELFSGIGAQRKALERLGIPHEVVGISEIDKYAIQSYEAIFGKTHNYGDISTVERLDYADLWTYSFPCQDISVAGNQKGISEGTRSGLLYQVQRLLEVAKDEGTLPKYLLLENVKNLVGKKFKGQFDNWLFYLDQLGYDTYWQVLNAKNYGIPQNRERVFAVSIRKDLNETFEFPKPEVLTKKLADVLEDEVDEKFYLSEKTIAGFIKHNENHIAKGTGFLWKPRDLNSHASCLRANGALAPTDNTIVVEKVIGASRGRNPENPSDRTVGAPTEQRLEINTQGTSNTITTVQKDNYVVEKIVCEQRCDEGLRFFKGDVVGTLRTIDACGDKRVVENIIQVGNIVSTGNWDNPQRGRIYSTEGISPALNTVGGGGLEPKIIEGIRIRKLTPLECWRLMGFDDEDFYKAQQSGVSNSQLYKQAGNSIVVDVLEKIFQNIKRK